MINDEDRNGIWHWQRGGRSGATKEPKLISTLSTLTPAILLDTYNESNKNTSSGLYLGSLNPFGGQCFSNINPVKLNSCKFFLAVSGSPTGNITAKIYALTGTYGTDAKPTGSVLATSSSLDVSTLTASFQLTTFTFSGINAITLSASTNYALVIDGSGAGNSGNQTLVGVDTSSPTHSGNRCFGNGSSWTGDATIDVCFYVYGTLPGRFDFGGQQGHWFRHQMTIGGTTGTVQVRVGNGAAQTFAGGAGVVSFDDEYLSGKSSMVFTPSSNFDGDVTSITVYQLN